MGAAAALATLGLSTTDAVASLLVFVVVGSVTIALPVIHFLVAGDAARARLDELKAWLGTHNDAVMTVLFLVVGVKLIADAIAPLTA
ncbi:MAG: GAP family protein [Acidobacteriota bacterium]